MTNHNGVSTTENSSGSHPPCIHEPNRYGICRWCRKKVLTNPYPTGDYTGAGGGVVMFFLFLILFVLAGVGVALLIWRPG